MGDLNLNLNRIYKDPNQILTEIYKYPNETKIFEFKNSKSKIRIDSNQTPISELPP